MIERVNGYVVGWNIAVNAPHQTAKIRCYGTESGAKIVIDKEGDDMGLIGGYGTSRYEIEINNH